MSPASFMIDPAKFSDHQETSHRTGSGSRKGDGAFGDVLGKFLAQRQGEQGSGDRGQAASSSRNQVVAASTEKAAPVFPATSKAAPASSAKPVSDGKPSNTGNGDSHTGATVSDIGKLTSDEAGPVSDGADMQAMTTAMLARLGGAESGRKAGDQAVTAADKGIAGSQAGAAAAGEGTGKPGVKGDAPVAATRFGMPLRPDGGDLRMHVQIPDLSTWQEKGLIRLPLPAIAGQAQSQRPPTLPAQGRAMAVPEGEGRVALAEAKQAEPSLRDKAAANSRPQAATGERVSGTELREGRSSQTTGAGPTAGLGTEAQRAAAAGAAGLSGSEAQRAAAADAALRLVPAPQARPADGGGQQPAPLHPEGEDARRLAAFADDAAGQRRPGQGLAGQGLPGLTARDAGPQGVTAVASQQPMASQQQERAGLTRMTEGVTPAGEGEREAGRSARMQASPAGQSAIATRTNLGQDQVELQTRNPLTGAEQDRAGVGRTGAGEDQLARQLGNDRIGLRYVPGTHPEPRGTDQAVEEASQQVRAGQVRPGRSERPGSQEQSRLDETSSGRRSGLGVSSGDVGATERAARGAQERGGQEGELPRQDQAGQRVRFEAVARATHQHAAKSAGQADESFEARGGPPPAAASSETPDNGSRFSGWGQAASGATGTGGSEGTQGATGRAAPFAPHIPVSVDDIAAVIRRQMAGGSQSEEVRIRLRPPQLGELSIRLSLEQGNLSARLIADSTAAKSLLENHLPQLRQALEEQGLRLEQFSVSVGGRESGGTGQQSLAGRGQDAQAGQLGGEAGQDGTDGERGDDGDMSARSLWQGSVDLRV